MSFFRRVDVPRWFAIAWRVTILALPWQTRWFLDAQLAGWPWEQGRVSFYLSWIPLLLTIGLGIAFLSPVQRRISKKILWLIAALIGSSLIATRLEIQALRAVTQWWVQIGLLGGFIFVMRRHAIPWKVLATWIILSLIPQAFLGLFQYAVQQVWGTSWLGIAEQLPERPGVSVVEHGLYRVLRVYGGFPHPNIFGGWLVMGGLTSLLLTSVSREKRSAIFAMSASCLFAITLLLTYSRSAWLAAIVGGMLLLISVIRSKRVNQFFVLGCVVTLLAAGIVGFSQREHLLARGSVSSRLEEKSLDVRAQSFREGIDQFRMHPVFGSGPNADLGQKASTLQRSPAPLEPAHNVFLLIFVQFGIIGSILFCLLIAQLKSQRIARSWFPAVIFLSPLLIIACVDHYLWSYWSGHVLIMMSILLARPVHD